MWSHVRFFLYLYKYVGLFILLYILVFLNISIHYVNKTIWDSLRIVLEAHATFVSCKKCVFPHNWTIVNIDT